jgi:hypothetical protein
MERKEYIFIYNNMPIYRGWFAPFHEATNGSIAGALSSTLSEVQTFAQGITIGLRAKGVKSPEIKVWELGEKEKLVLIQR